MTVLNNPLLVIVISLKFVFVSPNFKYNLTLFFGNLNYSQIELNCFLKQEFNMIYY